MFTPLIKDLARFAVSTTGDGRDATVWSSNDCFVMGCHPAVIAASVALHTDVMVDALVVALHDVLPASLREREAA